MHYVKNGVFGKDLSDTISNLFASRSMSDYDDYFELSEEDVLKLRREIHREPELAFREFKTAEKSGSRGCKIQ